VYGLYGPEVQCMVGSSVMSDRKQQAERNQLACCLQGLQAVRQIAAAWQRLPRC
jgi:hypothetical protein